MNLTSCALPHLPHAQKLALVTAVPLVLAVATIAFLAAGQSRAAAEREIAAPKEPLIDAKKARAAQ